MPLWIPEEGWSRMCVNNGTQSKAVSSLHTAGALHSAVLAALVFLMTSLRPALAEGQRITLDFADSAATPGISFKLHPTARVLKGEGIDGSGALKITGNNQNNNYGAWINNVKVRSGATCAASIYSKTTRSFPAGYAMLLLFMRDANDKPVGVSEQLPGGLVHYVFLDNSDGWTRTVEKVLIPEGADHVNVGIRIDAAAGTEALFCSRLAFEELATDPYAGFPNVDFEGGQVNRRNDVIMKLGPGAALKTTTVNTREAHSGEWYVEVDGVNHDTQYGLTVNDIWVKPGAVYSVSFSYRMSDNFPPQCFIMMVFQFAGKPWRSDLVASKYFFPAARVAKEWTDFKADVVTDPKAANISLLFRLESVLPGNRLYLDDIAVRRGEPGVFLTWEIDPKSATLTGAAKPSGDIADRVNSVQVFILRDGKVVKHSELKPGEEKFGFDLKDLTDGVPYYLSANATLKEGSHVPQKISDLASVVAGRHRLTVRLPDGVEAPIELTDKDCLFYTFIKVRPWEGNEIGVLGKNDLPPPPWSSVTYNEKTGVIRTWNNTITPGKGLCSLRIGFRKPACELTSEPIAITLNGKSLSDAFRFSLIKPSPISPNRVVVESTGAGGNATVDTRVAVEFDGFLRHMIVIRPAEGTAFKVEDLALKMNFPKGYLKYSYTEKGLTLEPSFATKEFNPVYWFGNHHTGICWCAERLFPSVAKQEKDWLSLTPDEGGTDLTIHLVNRPVEVRDAPLKVEFALLPTPARPFQPRLRNVRFRSGTDSTLDVVGTGLTSAVKYFAYPEIASKEEFARYMNSRGVTAADTLFYFGVSYAMETIPQMTYFKKDWINVPTHRYATEDSTYHQYATGDYTTVKWNPSWTDLCLFKLKEFLQQTGIKGTYLDTAFPNITEENGERYCPVFAGREFHKRVYVLLHRMFGDHAWTISHTGLGTALPYSAFSDFVLNGEHFRQQLFEHAYYLDFATLDEMRATVAAPLGPGHMFLTQYWQTDKAKNRALMAQAAAFAMIHDAVVWVAGQDVLLKMMRQKYNFGDLIKAGWHPYWEPNPYLQSDNYKVIFSLYERDGDLFIIPFNTTSHMQEATLKLRDGYTRKLPAAARVKVYDPVADEESTQELKDNGILLNLEPYCTKLLTIRRGDSNAKG